MLTDLRFNPSASASTPDSSSTISPKSSTESPQPSSQFKRFRHYSPPPLPIVARRPSPPAPPKTLQDEPDDASVAATHERPLLVRALLSLPRSSGAGGDGGDGEEEEEEVDAGALEFACGQEIKVAIVTANWCWGSYVDQQGVEHAGIFPKCCVERVVVEEETVVQPTANQDDDQHDASSSSYMTEFESYMCLGSSSSSSSE